MLVIDNYEKLNALLKLLWTAKFDIPTENSIEIIASPLIAEIYQQTYQATIELSQKQLRGNDALSLENELTSSHSFEIQAVETHIDFLHNECIKWEPERKRAFVKFLLSPLVVPEHTIEEIVVIHSS